MKYQDLETQDCLATLILSKEEAVQLVSDLVAQLADAPNAGSHSFPCYSSSAGWQRRVAFMVRNSK
jgi:hypothetical protein